MDNLATFKVSRRLLVALASMAASTAALADKAPAAALSLEQDDGYRGIWYFNQPTKDAYRYKYSGGMATYPQQHAPIAVYCPAVDRTFFVYGGTSARNSEGRQELLHMVSFFDHRTGMIPRPRILLSKATADAHDNPTLQVDGAGFLWIFSPSHGTSRPSYIHRSARPYDITRFEQVVKANFSYPQCWHVPQAGFLFLHTRYNGARAAAIPAARALFSMTSFDGVVWDEARVLAGIFQGNYQISWRSGKRIATAFDCHPSPGGLNARANIYYLETDDLGREWRTDAGMAVQPPITNAHSEALVYDSQNEGLLVYLKDLNFDRDGHPIILFLASKGFEPGPQNGPRTWHTLRWTGTSWVKNPITTSDNNYDHGSLYVEPDGTWRLIAPTDPGPQRFNPGGEMVMWTSKNQGRNWLKAKQLTHGSSRNHTYARRPFDAAPGFYALWADGHAREPSESHLYFATMEGRVFRLPSRMHAEFERPEEVIPQ